MFFLNYFILSTDKEQIEYINSGAKKLEEVTCLKFPIYNERKHTDFITIEVNFYWFFPLRLFEI